ncbi:MAG: hypothetical protein MJ171_00820, partial [Clostridia bacterium]|nr:hypothetical protein [Clostridia bacterium]
MSKNFDENLLYEDVDNGSSLRGILGAFIGALIGSIPWFIAYAFLDFFSAWLGALVGFTSLYGYKKMGGVKDTKKATVVTLLTSAAAIVISMISALLFLLVREPDFIEVAEEFNVPVLSLAWSAVFSVDSLPYILPNLGIGLFLGVLGIFFTRNSVLKYTEPDKYEERFMSPLKMQGTESDSDSESVVSDFTVREKKSTLIALYVCAAIFIIFAAGLLIVAGYIIIEEDEDIGLAVLFSVMGLVFLFVSVLLISHKKRRVLVRGTGIEASPVLGKTKYFSVDEIGTARP